MVIAELMNRGIELKPHEGVAIVQQLICRRFHASRAPQTPFGPPSVDTVELRSDGAAVCISSDVTPAVAELAILLEALLARSPRVPESLQKIIARALYELDGPPFDSLDEFSSALSQHEHADRAEVIRGLFNRVRVPESKDFQPAQQLANRRRNPEIVAELRRDLREADRARFELTMAHRAVQKWRRALLVPTIVAGASAGIVLTVGETIHFARPNAALMPVPPKDIALPLPARLTPPSDPPVGNVLLQPKRIGPSERQSPTHVKAAKRTTDARPAEGQPGRRFLGLRVISDSAVTSWRFVGRKLGL
jgi:hypothetical protein